MKAGRSPRAGQPRSATRSGPRRALLLVFYLLISVGTPLGHSLLLSVHVAREHTSVSGLNDWFSERAWSTMRMAEQARLTQEARLAAAGHDRLHAEDRPHEHPSAESGQGATTHVHNLPAADSAKERTSRAIHTHAAGSADTHGHRAPSGSETEARRGQSGDRTLAPGEHEHGGLIHSHEPGPETDLASLTAHNSDHYVAPPKLALTPSDVTITIAVWPASLVADVVTAVLTPPPRHLV